MKRRKLWWILPLFVTACGIAALVRAGAENGVSGFLVQKQLPADVGEEREGQSGQEDVPTDAEGKKESAQEPFSENGKDSLIYVHICGAVFTEGVYALAPGQRVVDAVTAAGGFTDEADRSYHNLAGLLIDGQKIYIPTKAETEELSFWERERADQKEDGSESGTGKQGKKLNLNTAGKEELMTLPGIGESKAESILRYRNKVGSFKSIEEITNVSGIGAALLEQIRELIFAE